LAGAIRLVAASLHQRGFGKGDVFAIYWTLANIEYVSDEMELI
jgi:hypothetical protein